MCIDKKKNVWTAFLKLCDLIQTIQTKHIANNLLQTKQSAPNKTLLLEIIGKIGKEKKQRKKCLFQANGETRTLGGADCIKQQKPDYLKETHKDKTIGRK